MKRIIGMLCCVVFVQPALAQSASEKVDKRLAALLAPGFAPMHVPNQPANWLGSKGMLEIVLPIRPYIGVTVRLPAPAHADVKVRPASEGTPLVAFRDAPKPPREIELPTQPLIRLPSVDVATPLPIPILGEPVKDRASLGDPAFEASLAVALKPFTPVRNKPVPFAPQNLPDPFENVRYGHLRTPPEESATPPVIPLTKPK